MGYTFLSELNRISEGRNNFELPKGTKMKDISVIIPTFNEKGNLQELFRRIDNSLDCAYECILVDDNSADGTGEFAEELSRKYPITIIHRQSKKGLASAVAEGFQHASGNIFVVMDADLQHSPEKIPELIKELEKGRDVAIASRYIESGGTEKWSYFRKLISYIAGFLVKTVLPRVRRIRDPLSGFFALKREVIKESNLEPYGYKILLEILAKGNYEEVAEVPFVFKERKTGKSKLSLREEVDYLKHLYKLSKSEKETIRFLKFCLVGLSGVFVNLGLLWLLTEVAGWFYQISAVFSIEISILSNFILNETWTFRERRTSAIKILLSRMLKFNIVGIGGLLINMAVLFTLTEFLGIYYLISEMFGIGGAFLWNFTVNTWWTWKIET